MDGSGQIPNWAIQLGSGVLVAFLASWFTTIFARKKFLAEKIWEKRAEAYGAILEAVFVMKQSYEDDLEALEDNRDFPKDEQEKSYQAYQAAKEEIYRRVEVEQFFLSSEVPVKIAEMHAGLEAASRNAEGVYYEYLDRSYHVLRTTQNEIRKIAKSHLKIDA